MQERGLDCKESGSISESSIGRSHTQRPSWQTLVLEGRQNNSMDSFAPGPGGTAPGTKVLRSLGTKVED